MANLLCLLFGHQKVLVPFSSNRFYCRRCGLDFGVTVDPVRAPRGPSQVVVDSHLPGKRVTVYYDPARPARSALLLEQAPWYWEWAIWWTVFAPAIACYATWTSNKVR